MLRRWDDSQKYLSDNPHLVCEETANYLVIWCIDLEVEEVWTPPPPPNAPFWGVLCPFSVIWGFLFGGRGGGSIPGSFEDFGVFFWGLLLGFPLGSFWFLLVSPFGVHLRVALVAFGVSFRDSFMEFPLGSFWCLLLVSPFGSHFGSPLGSFWFLFGSFWGSFEGCFGRFWGFLLGFPFGVSFWGFLLGFLYGVPFGFLLVSPFGSPFEVSI